MIAKSLAGAAPPVQLQLPLQDFWENRWWPRYPFATDCFEYGLYPMDRERAKSKRYVQLNPEKVKNWLAIDVDDSDGALKVLWDSHGLVPNLITENRANGHVHALWALGEPVTTSEAARPEPIYLAAAVAEGLRRRSGGDPGYSGFLTKNPLHSHWSVNDSWHENLYELNDLRTALGKQMPGFGWWRSKPTEQAGLGRNVTLFETVRLRSYRLVRAHWYDSPGLLKAIEESALTANADFTDPLPLPEALGVAKSIHKWITTQSNLWRDGPLAYEATFSTLQSVRGKRSAATRAAKTREHLEQTAEALQDALPGLERATNAQVAEAAGVSLSTVKRYLSIPRAQYLADAERLRQTAITLYAHGLSMPEIGASIERHKSTVYRALTRL